MEKKHLRISVKTRCAAVITAVNNGATSADLAAEYRVTWETIRDAVRNTHYRVGSCPANAARYKEFLAKVKANDAAAAANATNPATHSKPQASGTKQVSTTKNSEPTTATTTAAVDSHKPCINLVETGVLLHLGIEYLLSLNNGTAVFMVPRFCIKELQRMSESQRLANDPVKEKAKNVLLKMYAEGIWNVRFIPFEPVEQGLIPKTPDVKDYKSRSFGVAEAALEIYVDTSYRVSVLTTSMEIQHLIHRAVKDEDLGSDITVTRVYSK